MRLGALVAQRAVGGARAHSGSCVALQPFGDDLTFWRQSCASTSLSHGAERRVSATGSASLLLGWCANGKMAGGWFPSCVTPGSPSSGRHRHRCVTLSRAQATYVPTSRRHLQGYANVRGDLRRSPAGRPSPSKGINTSRPPRQLFRGPFAFSTLRNGPLRSTYVRGSGILSPQSASH